MLTRQIAHRFFIIAPVVATGVSSCLGVLYVRLWRTFFFISHTLKAYAHQARFVSFSGSKKGARFTGLSLLLSEDQLRSSVDPGIVSKLCKDDVRFLCRHWR